MRRNGPPERHLPKFTGAQLGGGFRQLPRRDDLTGGEALSRQFGPRFPIEWIRRDPRPQFLARLVHCTPPCR